MGELPRAVTLVADRHLVGRVAPGTRVTITGIYSIYSVPAPTHPSPTCFGSRRQREMSRSLAPATDMLCLRSTLGEVRQEVLSV